MSLTARAWRENPLVTTGLLRRLRQMSPRMQIRIGDSWLGRQAQCTVSIIARAPDVTELLVSSLGATALVLNLDAWLDMSFSHRRNTTFRQSLK